MSEGILVPSKIKINYGVLYFFKKLPGGSNIFSNVVLTAMLLCHYAQETSISFD